MRLSKYLRMNWGGTTREGVDALKAHFVNNLYILTKRKRAARNAGGLFVIAAIGMAAKPDAGAALKTGRQEPLKPKQRFAPRTRYWRCTSSPAVRAR